MKRLAAASILKSGVPLNELFKHIKPSEPSTIRMTPYTAARWPSMGISREIVTSIEVDDNMEKAHLVVIYLRKKILILKAEMKRFRDKKMKSLEKSFAN